jgi:hypothetical protein
MDSNKDERPLRLSPRLFPPLSRTTTPYSEADAF